MRKIDEYLVTIDTIYPDGYARETLFRSAGDMLSPRRPEPAGNWLQRLIAGLRLWQEKRSGRLALRELTDDQLRDIGVTRSEARTEISKSSFWF